MLNKEAILKKLETLNLNKDKLIIISGAALVLQDIIEYTSDIDLSCEKEYYKEINWNTKIGYFNTEIKYYDCFEIGTNFYDINEITTVNKFNVQNLNSIYKLKLLENKLKDKETIKKLEKILKI